MKPKLLNVREQLKYHLMLFEGFAKYGDCPAIREEINKARFMTKLILANHEESRKSGDRKDRKDIRVGR